MLRSPRHFVSLLSVYVRADVGERGPGVGAVRCDVSGCQLSICAL